MYIRNGWIFHPKKLKSCQIAGFLYENIKAGFFCDAKGSLRDARFSLRDLKETSEIIKMDENITENEVTLDSLLNEDMNIVKVLDEDGKEEYEKINLSKWADGVGEETVDFFINEDGFATVDMKSSMFCNGIYSMIYETRDDTLFATQNYARVVKKLDPATKDSVIVEYEEFRSHCVCQIDLELKIPSEFVGTKYVDFEGDRRSIVYKKRK